jgi:mono/diheme cytochrome c family protein
MKLMTILLVLLVVVGAGVLAVVYSGVYDVGTGNHDNGLMNWVLDTSMTHSVQRHARGISAPPLSDPAMIQLGAAHYHEMCAGCHGAPGVAHAEIAEGLWPEAPDLAKTAGDWTPAQLYWIIKNGLKFTSMPAWGPSHSEKELWAMTAFVQKLPSLSPAEYKAMQDKAAQAGGINMRD